MGVDRVVRRGGRRPSEDRLAILGPVHPAAMGREWQLDPQAHPAPPHPAPPHAHPARARARDGQPVQPARTKAARTRRTTSSRSWKNEFLATRITRHPAAARSSKRSRSRLN